MTERSLVWIEGDSEGGWACSICCWRFPVPTLLGSGEAKDAYDRLAVVKFGKHQCEPEISTPASSSQTDTEFADRARALITRGFKPKVAVELLLTELEFEFRNDSRRMEKVRAQAEDFLQNLRKGLI